MPFNGSGTFSAVYSWVADAAAGINITASRFDTQDGDFATYGFGNCLTRDGQGQPTANLPMAGFKHTGAAVATATGQYVTYQQITTSAAALPIVGTTLTLTNANVTMADSASIHATTTGSGVGVWGRNTSAGGGIFFRGNTGGAFTDGIEFNTGSVATVRGGIDANGNFYIGGSSNPNSGRGYMSGVSTLTLNSTNGVNAIFSATGVNCGSVTNSAGTTFYNTTSDARLKINDGSIEPDEAARIIEGLRPRWFRWKAAPGADSQPGFMAQQVARVFPWAVTRGERRKDQWQMDASKLLPIVITELQALRKRVAQLEKLA
jgi:hypothetical protein